MEITQKRSNTFYMEVRFNIFLFHDHISPTLKLWYYGTLIYYEKLWYYGQNYGTMDKTMVLY